MLLDQNLDLQLIPSVHCIRKAMSLTLSWWRSLWYGNQPIDFVRVNYRENKLSMLNFDENILFLGLYTNRKISLFSKFHMINIFTQVASSFPEVLENRCSKIFCEIHRKTTVMEPLFYEVTTLYHAVLRKKKTPT